MRAKALQNLNQNNMAAHAYKPGELFRRLHLHNVQQSELLHILPRRLILLRVRRSHATLALYCCVAWAVNCLWRKLCIIKSDSKKPQHWNAAARADNKGKRTLTAKMRSSAIISIYMPSDHATMSGNVTPGPQGCKFACKRGPFFDHG